MENVKRAIVYSKPTCPYCVKAKNFLKNNDIPIEERIIGRGYSKENIAELLDEIGIDKEVKTVPQIFFELKDSTTLQYIGGCSELLRKYK